MLRLQPPTIAALQRLASRPDEAGPSQFSEGAGPHEAPIAKLVRTRTPLVPSSDARSRDGRAAECELLIPGQTTSDDPAESSEWQCAITGGSGSSLTVTGDLRGKLVHGSRVRIIGSTGNDGWYELTADPDSSGGSSTLAISPAMPDATADGNLIISGPCALTETTDIYSAAAQTCSALLPGDVGVLVRVDRQFVVIGGPQTLWCYLDEELIAPTIEDDVLTPATAEATVWGFAPPLDDPEGAEVWRSLGITLEITSIWESVTGETGTLCSVTRCNGRWMLTAIDCSPSGLFA